MNLKKMYKQITSIAVILLLGFSVNAQLKVGANPTSINSNSVLEMESTNKGMLLPRLGLSSTSSFAPLSAHIAGMVVYNTATVSDVTPGYFYNDGSKWVRLAGGSGSGAGSTTAGQLITITNGAGATMTAMTVATDTTALKTFMSIAIQNGSITGKNTTGGSLITVTNGAGATLTAMNLAVDTAALKTFINNKVQSSVSAPLTGDGTVSNPIGVTRATATGGVLTTVSNGTNAAFTALKYDVDTTALKTFINNKVQSSVSAPLTGDGTVSNPIGVTRATATGGVLTTVSNGTNAAFTALKYDVDTAALKTFINNKVQSSVSAPLTGDGTVSNPIGVTRATATSGVLTTVSNGTNAAFTALKYDVDTAALKTFINNKVQSSVSAPLTGDGTVSNPIGVTRATATSGVLTTVSNGTNAAFTALKYDVDTTALKTFMTGKVASAVSAPLSGDGTSASPLSVTRATATSGVLTTVSNGTNAAFTALKYDVDTAALKTFINNKVQSSVSAPLTGDGTVSNPIGVTRATATSGVLTTVSNGTNAAFTALKYDVDTAALKTFINNKVQSSVSAPLTGDGTVSNPIGVNRATATSGVLTIVSNGTNAAFTALKYDVDTAALKTFINNKVQSSVSAPLTGDGTVSNPIGVTRATATSGVLTTVSNGTNAAFTALKYDVDTAALTHIAANHHHFLVNRGLDFF
jgi:uncharacterized protein GlcG (DUF336 family)